MDTLIPTSAVPTNSALSFMNRDDTFYIPPKKTYQPGRRDDSHFSTPPGSAPRPLGERRPQHHNRAQTFGRASGKARRMEFDLSEMDSLFQGGQVLPGRTNKSIPPHSRMGRTNSVSVPPPTNRIPLMERPPSLVEEHQKPMMQAPAKNEPVSKEIERPEALGVQEAVAVSDESVGAASSDTAAEAIEKPSMAKENCSPPQMRPTTFPYRMASTSTQARSTPILSAAVHEEGPVCEERRSRSPVRRVETRRAMRPESIPRGPMPMSMSGRRPLERMPGAPIAPGGQQGRHPPWSRPPHPFPHGAPRPQNYGFAPPTMPSRSRRRPTQFSAGSTRTARPEKSDAEKTDDQTVASARSMAENIFEGLTNDTSNQPVELNPDFSSFKYDPSLIAKADSAEDNSDDDSSDHESAASAPAVNTEDRASSPIVVLATKDAAIPLSIDSQDGEKEDVTGSSMVSASLVDLEAGLKGMRNAMKKDHGVVKTKGRLCLKVLLVFLAFLGICGGMIGGWWFIYNQLKVHFRK
ncbi:hypothetical protein BJ508DRAFT_333696 [Ascobolus immersus RN42]|uniref:Uncharacterized protein n=1 Tax=Ascobolus immersus RN42 TaxID=1160509 RepID=A0A3N4HVW7_ASCIM|nr:hypothetical protein BJ508DRAFT_333696 [Ascobolus immersus RN42]